MKKRYKLTIDLATLNHLGIGLYSNIPSVLSEVVANAWDANAGRVDVKIDAAGVISVKDNGWGMTEAEINDRFLKVGYRKRNDPKAPKPGNRAPMGRKGIGKLALFSIADTIEVQSVKLDARKRVVDRNGFVMRAAEIERSIKAGRGDYEPEVLPEAKIRISSGTLITIGDLKKNAHVTASYLRTRIARRFTVIGTQHHFVVAVNGDEITIEDRDYFDRLEYLWCVGPKSGTFENEAKNVLRSETISGVVDQQRGYVVNGWVGTTAEHKSIEQGNNGIAVLARGKIIHENLLPDLKEGRVFSKYVIGELNADFLDVDEHEDIATSDRQSVKETDPRFAALRDFVKTAILNRIGNVWTDWRNEDQSNVALKNPAIEEWFESLDPSIRNMPGPFWAKSPDFPRRM